MREQRSSVAQRSCWPLIWGGVLLVLVALGGITLGLWQTSRPRSGGERPLEQLGNFGTVPEFAFTERSERHVSRLTFWLHQALLQQVLGPRLVWAHTGTEHTPLLHSSRFVLVDRQARIRGYYHSDEDAALQRLRRDVRMVLREKR